MSSLELNKVAGSVLLAVLATVVIGKIGDNLVSTGGGHGGGGEHGATTASAPAPKKEEPLEPILGMLASADPAAGEKVFAKCKSCHTVEKGGPNGIGPDLWGVVGRAPGTHEGFNYSDALKALSDTKWTYSNLNGFIHKPREYAKGTKMTFAGLPKTSDRANVVAYLRTLADTPEPLPTQAEIDEANRKYEEAKQALEAPAPTADAGHGAAAGGQQAAATPEQPAEPAVPIAEQVAQADPSKGERVFAKCKACHSVEKGGPNKIGPNLWGVVGRAPASHEGFNYSDAMQAHKGDTWTIENLNAFLHKPKDYAPGTKMTFAGLSKDSDRANLLAYLKTLSD